MKKWKKNSHIFDLIGEQINAIAAGYIENGNSETSNIVVDLIAIMQFFSEFKPFLFGKHNVKLCFFFSTENTGRIVHIEFSLRQ